MALLVVIRRLGGALFLLQIFVLLHAASIVMALWLFVPPFRRNICCQSSYIQDKALSANAEIAAKQRVEGRLVIRFPDCVALHPGHQYFLDRWIPASAGMTIYILK